MALLHVRLIARPLAFRIRLAWMLTGMLAIRVILAPPTRLVVKLVFVIVPTLVGAITILSVMLGWLLGSPLPGTLFARVVLGMLAILTIRALILRLVVRTDSPRLGWWLGKLMSPPALLLLLGSHCRLVVTWRVPVALTLLLFF